MPESLRTEKEKGLDKKTRREQMSSYSGDKERKNENTEAGWRQYTNGNVYVAINIFDGTKIRVTNDDEFSADFPESVDMKITDHCEMGCKMCHEGSTKTGKHSDLSDPDATFLRTLRQYTEIAIGGGAVTSHPQIDEFLVYLKERKILANVTLHERELMDNIERIQKWIDNKLVNGVGISLHTPFDQTVCDFAERNKNTVLHIIAGITPFDWLKEYGNRGLKLLVLGYKNWGRGEEYYRERQKAVDLHIGALERNIDKVFEMFKVVSFDNLALRQLNIRQHTDDEAWGLCYQGSDASHTMYIDLVKGEFAATSTSADRYNLMETIDDMFAKVKGTMSQMV